MERVQPCSQLALNPDAATPQLCVVEPSTPFFSQWGMVTLTLESYLELMDIKRHKVSRTLLNILRCRQNWQDLGKETNRPPFGAGCGTISSF